MSQSLLRSPFLMFMISVSFFGLFLVGTLAFNPPIPQNTSLWRKPVIGLLFEAICMLGIIAASFPRQCSAIFHLGKEKDISLNPNDLASHGGSPTLQGHHPDCGNFSAHVVKMDGKTFCAACTGLLLGALIALVGAAICFFGDWHIEQNSSLAVFVGALGVGFGLFQFRFRSFVRLLLNAFFVIGTFMVLVGIDELIQSVFVDLYLVVLAVFWLSTRILLSQWDHWRICYSCRNPCEIHEYKNRSVSAAQPIQSANDN